jgi:hypothetical protein
LPKGKPGDLGVAHRKSRLLKPSEAYCEFGGRLHDLAGFLLRHFS